MKHKKKNNGNNKYDIEFLQAVIEGLNERNIELEEEVERLKTEIAETNDVNIQQDEDDQNYRNLTKLNTLLLVLMGLTQNYCDDSDLGKSLRKAIENFYGDTALSLVKKVDFRLSGRNNDEEEYEEDGEEVF